MFRDYVKELIEYVAYRRTGNYVEWEELTDVTNGTLEQDVRDLLTNQGYIDCDFYGDDDHSEWYLTTKGSDYFCNVERTGFEFGNYDQVVS